MTPAYFIRLSSEVESVRFECESCEWVWRQATPYSLGIFGLAQIMGYCNSIACPQCGGFGSPKDA
jgi:hypothetical protein